MDKINIKNNIKKIWNNKRLRIISLTSVCLIIVGIVFVCNYNSKQSVNSEYIIARLQKSSELTTAKLEYTGMSEFNDSGITFISKADFIMVYKAMARAGIDVEDIKVNVDNISKTVFLTIPKAKILDVKVDASQIKYFDEDFALFNVDPKEDANKAVELAEKEAKKELANIGVLQMADTQAEALIKGLIQDAVPNNYEIKCK